MPSLTGKVVLITGAGSPIGLGHAMAVALAQAGARIALVDINRDTLPVSAEDVRKAGGPDAALPIVANIADPQQAEEAVERTVKEMGAIHVLINNGGLNLLHASGGRHVSAESRFWEVPPDVWARMVPVNVNGAYHMARAAVPHFLAQGWGRIIGVTTSLDTMIRGGGSPYGVTKAAHEAFVVIMAQDLAGTGVTANVLVPGGAAYTGGTPAGHGPGGLLPAEVMQAPAVWLASDESDGFTGQRIIAHHWDETLPIEQRLAKASAPAAWPQLGRQAVGRS